MRKNKRNLLVAIAAMGLVAAGTGAVSTFAWFKASTASSIKTYAADTEGLSTKAGSANMGQFIVTAVPQGSLAAVELTNTSGQSYIFTGGETGEDGTGKVEVPVSDGVRTVDCKLKVTYESKTGEAAKTAAEIKTIWTSTIGNKAIGIKATSDANVRFLTSATPADAAAWAGTVGTTGVTYSVSNANLIALVFADCAGNGAVSDSTTNADAASDFFVAITGNDTKVEIAQEHTLTFTPQTAA